MSFASTRNPSRQAAGIVSVVVLHALIIYALTTGLGRQVVEVIRSPLETRVIDDVKKPTDTPPPPLPKLAPPPPPFVPLPDFKVQSAPSANAITAVTAVKPVEPPPVAEPTPVVEIHVPPARDPARNCANPEYPSISRRMEESGTVSLLFLVDVDGKVLEGRVDKSSGYSRLDTAALNALQQCQFKPGTANGKAERAWAHINYNWKLE